MRPFLVALVNPLNILMLFVSLGAGLMAAWWLFPLGLVLWAVMVFNFSRDPSLRISHTLQSRTALAPRFQKYFDQLERSQVGIFNAIASTTIPAVKRSLQPIQVEVDHLVEQVHRLGSRMTKLENYRLVSQANSDLENDLNHIKGLIERTTDVVMLREYKQSQRSLEERIVNLQTVSTILDRVDAQLMSLCNKMDGLLAEVIRIQVSDPAQLRGQVSSLVDVIHHWTEELRNFEREAAVL